jgi:hypothetical protein
LIALHGGNRRAGHREAVEGDASEVIGGGTGGHREQREQETGESTKYEV